MILYSVIMFVTAVILLIIGALVYRGRTSLIHDYHQTNVKDKTAYGKAMGKALACISIPLVIAGTAALFVTSALPTLILIPSLGFSLIPLFITQKKYNGGLF